MKQFLALSIAAILLGGCGSGKSDPPLGKTVGQVTHQGKPVQVGSVIFEDAEQGLAFVAHLNHEGRFVFEVARGYGLPPGNYKVSVHPPMPKASLEYVPPSLDNKTYPNIPERYRSDATSGFSADVKSGENGQFHFDMK